MTQWNPYFYNSPHPLDPVAPAYLPSIEGDDRTWDDGSQNAIPMQTDEDDNAWVPQTYARGGYVPRYALEGVGSLLRSAGRDGDTVLAHINPQEAALLKSLGGRGSRNPVTGLPEFGWKKLEDHWGQRKDGWGLPSVVLEDSSGGQHSLKVAVPFWEAVAWTACSLAWVKGSGKVLVF